MPTFEIFAAHSGRVHRWDNFDDYDLVKVSATTWRLDYDEDRGGEPLDPERQPERITLTLDGGRITKLDYRDGDGRKLAELRGVSYDKGLFEYFQDVREEGRELFQMLARPGLTIVGGRQSNDQWDKHDDITTSAFKDVVDARSGNDYIKDFGGADTYNGGSGRDTVSYDEWGYFAPYRATGGIVADLAAGTAKGPDGTTDRLINIENVRGTFLNDTMKGNGQDNYFEGGRGRDTIDGRGGFDVIGVAGNEDDDYLEGRTTLTNLHERFSVDVYGTRDALTSIEGAEGSASRDTFIDNGGDNYFEGQGGNDRFVVSGGGDYLVGEEGADRFVFRTTAFGEDRIRDFDGGEGDRIEIVAANSIGDLSVTRSGGDTLIRLDADSVVVLEDYDGPVASFLLF